MKNFTLKFSAFIFAFTLLFAAFGTSSCKKDKTCHGKVRVVDSSAHPVGSAAVRLSAPSVGGDIIYDGTTDGSGEVNFDVKLPAIFDVTATKGTDQGVGVLRLDEPGKDNDVTITME